MKKFLGKFFFVASVSALGFASFRIIDQGGIESLKSEAQRYSGIVNTDYLILVFVFLIGSFLAGWLWSKSKQI